MGTKNNPGKFDCYAAAEPDEPMFALLGRDKHAPTLVWLWSVLRELDGEDAAKVAEARECVVNMVVWQTLKGKRAAGIAQSVLAGVFELMRAANVAVKDAVNSPSDLVAVRGFLCESKIEE